MKITALIHIVLIGMAMAFPVHAQSCWLSKISILNNAIPAMRLPFEAGINAASYKPTHGLSVTYRISQRPQSSETAASNWFDVFVVNESSHPFKGTICDHKDYGAVVVEPNHRLKSSVTSCLKKAFMDAMIYSFTIPPHSQKTFHLLLSDIVPARKAGVFSETLIFPIEDSDRKRFALLAPFAVKISLT